MKNIKSLLLIVITLCYGHINAKPVIGTQTFSWTDSGRKDDIENGLDHVVEVQVWYPAGWAIMGEGVVENAAPEERFYNIDFNMDLTMQPFKNPYPVVIVSHCDKMAKEQYSSLCQAIARNKFVVMMIKNYDDTTDKTHFTDIEFMFNESIQASLQNNLAQMCDFGRIGVVVDFAQSIKSSTSLMQNGSIQCYAMLFRDGVTLPTDKPILAYFPWSEVHLINFLTQNLNDQTKACTIF